MGVLSTAASLPPQRIQPKGDLQDRVRGRSAERKGSSTGSPKLSLGGARRSRSTSSGSKARQNMSATSSKNLRKLAEDTPGSSGSHSPIRVASWTEPTSTPTPSRLPVRSSAAAMAHVTAPTWSSRLRNEATAEEKTKSKSSGGSSSSRGGPAKVARNPFDDDSSSDAEAEEGAGVAPAPWRPASSAGSASEQRTMDQAREEMRTMARSMPLVQAALGLGSIQESSSASPPPRKSPSEKNSPDWR